MIYVLGSVNADLVARVPRIPAAGETIAADRFYIGQGGKGANQAVAIAKLGGEVTFIGRVGDDAFGEAAVKSMKGYGVNVAGLKKTENVNTGIAMIVVENGENRIMLDRGANYAVTPADVDEGLSGAKKGDVLIMQLEIPLPVVEYAAEKARSLGMTVILNPAPAVPLTEKLVGSTDIIAPNETETEILTGVLPSGDVELALAVKKLYKMGAKKVLVTLGERGAAVCEGQTITYVMPRKVKAVDTTGAGDTFIGACALRLTAGDSLLGAAEFASVASSITVTREGAAASVPTLDEVNEVIAREGLARTRS